MLQYELSQPGDHWVANSLAVLAAVQAVGADLAVAGLALADMGGLKGRGARHRLPVQGGEALLIDEHPQAVFDFEEKRGYCRSGFPEPGPEHGWTRRDWDDSLREAFFGG